MRAHHCSSTQYFSTSIVANDLFLQKGTAREDSDCAVSSESAFLHLQPRIMIRTSVHAEDLEWSGDAMVLGKLPVPGLPTIWITVGQGPTALVVGAGGGCLDIFTLIYPFSPLSPSLWKTARNRLKYCLKGPLNP